MSARTVSALQVAPTGLLTMDLRQRRSHLPPLQTTAVVGPRPALIAKPADRSMGGSRHARAARSALAQLPEGERDEPRTACN